MKHPEREEWVPYLYGEGKPADQHRLAAHLQTCDECRHEIEGWQRSLHRLDQWKLPRSPRPVTFAPWVQWAAAAAIVLGIGVGIGRLSARPLSPEQLRAAIEPELRRQVQQGLAQTVRTEVDRASAASLTASKEHVDNLVASLAETLEKGRSQDRLALAAALERFQTQYATDLLSLKKDVDTVAVNADAGFRQAEQQLVHLAGYSQPAQRQ